jgi:hypothetical protein
MKKTLLASMTLLCANALSAQMTNCPATTESQRLQALLGNDTFASYATTEFGADLTKSASVIAYDHIYDKWTVYSWDAKKKTLDAFKGDVSPSGDTLKVELPSGNTAIMFATRSNPFFFRGVAKSITVADSDDVAQLKKFASLAGNFLTKFIGDASKNMDRATNRALIADPAERPEEEAMKKDAEAIKAAAEALKIAIDELLKQATSVSDLQGKTVAYAQLIELRQKPGGNFPNIGEMKLAALNLSKSAAAVRDANDKLRDALEPYCAALATDATAALALLNSDAVKKAKSDVDAAEKAVARAKPADKPAKDKELEEKKEDLQDVIDAAKQNVINMKAASLKCPNVKSHRVWNQAVDGLVNDLKEGKEAFQNIIDVIGGGHDAVKQAGEALAKEPGAIKVAAFLGDAGTIADVYGLGATPPDACNYIDSPVLVRGGSFTAKTGKKLSGGFTISKTVDTTNIVLKHPETVERKVEVTSTSKWGLGVGVVYTPLELKSWTVDSTTKIVSKATEEAISGQTALFANFHPGRATKKGVSFGAQVGFNTSTDKPAIYGGISVDLGKWLRLGTGYSFHRNKRLAKGLHELTAVPADNSFRMEDYYPGAWYASLSLSLDGLPLFQ